MVPLSKSGLRLYRSVGSNPTLSASYHGEVLEWTIRHAWRACVAHKATVGSNPTLSATPYSEAVISYFSFLGKLLLMALALAIR